MMILLYIVIEFINLSPQFGSNPTIEQKEIYSRFPNYVNDEFKNIEKTIIVTSDLPMS